MSASYQLFLLCHSYVCVCAHACVCVTDSSCVCVVCVRTRARVCGGGGGCVCLCVSSSVNVQLSRLVQDEHADVGEGAIGVEQTDNRVVLVRIGMGEVDGVNVGSPVERLRLQPVVVVGVEDGVTL